MTRRGYWHWRYVVWRARVLYWLHYHAPLVTRRYHMSEVRFLAGQMDARTNDWLAADARVRQQAAQIGQLVDALSEVRAGVWLVDPATFEALHALRDESETLSRNMSADVRVGSGRLTVGKVRLIAKLVGCFQSYGDKNAAEFK